MSCSLSCTFVPGSAGTVGTLATGMSPVQPVFAGSYHLVASGCTDPGDTTNFSVSGATVSTTAPTAGTYRICVQTNQAGVSSTYSEFTVVGVSGATSSAAAVGMTSPICGNNFSAQPCTFAAGSNNVSVFGLTTGMVPADPTYGSYFYDPTGIHGTTPNYTMVASNAACPDAGDTTHFSFAYKNGNVQMGLMPGSGTVAGAYHICLQIAVPGAINTPQYQEITLTAVNDSITGVIPATTTLTDDAIDYGGLIQMQCLSAVSPQCATSKWTMASNANFTMAENGSITPVGHPADGTYNLSVSVGGAGPFTVTVNIVPHTNWNGGSLNRILTGFPAAPPNESPLLHVQTGRVPDFTAGFTSITGPQPCNNNLPLASATTCGPGGGWIPGGAGKAQGYPTVANGT